MYCIHCNLFVKGIEYFLHGLICRVRFVATCHHNLRKINVSLAVHVMVIFIEHFLHLKYYLKRHQEDVDMRRLEFNGCKLNVSLRKNLKLKIHATLKSD